MKKCQVRALSESARLKAMGITMSKTKGKRGKRNRRVREQDRAYRNSRGSRW